MTSASGTRMWLYRAHPGNPRTAPSCLAAENTRPARLQAEEVVLTDLVWICGPQERQEPASDGVTHTLREMHQADPENEPPLD